MSTPRVSVVIPTCDRGAVLVDTLSQFLALDRPASEIIVVDQTSHPAPETAAALAAMERTGRVRLIRREQRSIPAAMNHGVRAAAGDVVLFVDDDVCIDAGLVEAHARAHARARDQEREQRGDRVAVVAGQVIQPWQQPLPAGESGYPAGEEGDPDAFRFNASTRQRVRRFSGGNVSMSRAALLELGGFDENFIGAAYRFEADFAERVCRAGFLIEFDPAASLHHLRAPTGGTRGFGDHLRTAAPWHSAGGYYYLLLYPRTPGLLRRTLREAVQTLAGRDHLRRPWWIPVSALAQLLGLLLALTARWRGPRLPLGPGVDR